MALQAWEIAADGLDYNYKLGAFSNRSGRKRFVDTILAAALGRYLELARRYPELPVFGQPRPGETFDMTVTIDGGTSAEREVGRP